MALILKSCLNIDTLTGLLSNNILFAKNKVTIYLTNCLEFRDTYPLFATSYFSFSSALMLLNTKYIYVCVCIYASAIYEDLK